MDVSKSTTETFAWQPHAQMSAAQTAKVIAGIVDRNGLPKLSDLNHAEFWVDKIVLDAGCGVGLKTNAIARLGAKKVIGVDGSPTSLRHASAVSEELGLKNVTYINGFLEDIRSLLNANGYTSVDYICCYQVIHHTTGWQSIVEQFVDLLNPGGVLDIVWVDPTLGVKNGNSACWFLLKNRISYKIGSSEKSRLSWGKRLFGKIDKKFNYQDVKEDSYYADRYAAFYRIILPTQLLGLLEKRGMTVKESYPCLSFEEYLRQCRFTKSLSPTEIDKWTKIANRSRLHGKILTGLLRIKHFFRNGGTERRVILRRVNFLN